MKDHIRIIGDVHGLINISHPAKSVKTYLDIAKAAEYSIQLGDMGFNYSALNQLDPTKHRFFGGNHDNYDTITSVPHNLGDFGVVKHGGVSFFFCRGGFSIDSLYRLRQYYAGGPKTWWEQEQLTYKQGLEAFNEYKRAKPSIMLSHSCPTEIAKLIGKPAVLKNFGFDPDTFRTDTQDLLQAMFEVHQPDYWFFGHFHWDWSRVVNGTQFRCIDELSHVTLDEEGWWLQ